MSNVEQRHHSLSRRQIGPGPQLHVGDDAGDGRADFASLEVELGKRKVGDGLVVGGLRRTLVGNDLVHPLLGDDDTRRQRAVALQIRVSLVEHGALAEQHRLGLLQRDLIPRAIDPEQDVAVMDLLVVLDEHVGDEAGDIRSDRNHVGANMTIAGPGRIKIIVPQLVAGPERGKHHDTGQREAT